MSCIDLYLNYLFLRSLYICHVTYVSMATQQIEECQAAMADSEVIDHIMSDPSILFFIIPELVFSIAVFYLHVKVDARRS